VLVMGLFNEMDDRQPVLVALFGWDRAGFCCTFRHVLDCKSQGLFNTSQTGRQKKKIWLFACLLAWLLRLFAYVAASRRWAEYQTLSDGKMSFLHSLDSRLGVDAPEALGAGQAV